MINFLSRPLVGAGYYAGCATVFDVKRIIWERDKALKGFSVVNIAITALAFFEALRLKKSPKIAAMLSSVCVMTDSWYRFACKPSNGFDLLSSIFRTVLAVGTISQIVCKDNTTKTILFGFNLAIGSSAFVFERIAAFRTRHL